MGAFDISGRAFNAAEHYSSVSMQQGRVQLDADSSEDSEANSEKIRRLTADVAMQGGDPAPIEDSTSPTIRTAFAGFEPTGGLHALADEPGVASFAAL